MHKYWPEGPQIAAKSQKNVYENCFFSNNLYAYTFTD